LRLKLKLVEVKVIIPNRYLYISNRVYLKYYTIAQDTIVSLSPKFHSIIPGYYLHNAKKHLTIYIVFVLTRYLKNNNILNYQLRFG